MSNKGKAYKPRTRTNFTDTRVRALKPKKTQYHAWDEGTGSARGLGILVSPTGTKTYRVAYYFPGDKQARYMALGRVGELVPDDLAAEIEEARLRCRTAAVAGGERDRSERRSTHEGRRLQGGRRRVHREGAAGQEGQHVGRQDERRDAVQLRRLAYAARLDDPLQGDRGPAVPRARRRRRSVGLTRSGNDHTSPIGSTGI